MEEAAEPVAPSTPPQSMDLKYVPDKDILDYESLKTMKGDDGIDPARKECYLSPEEFSKVFKMDKSEFHTLPAWKQSRAKKDAGLF